MTGLAIAGASFLALSRVAGLERQVALLGAGCIGLGLAVPTMTALSLDLARAAPGLLFGYLFALEGAGHMAGPLLTAMLADVRGPLTLTGVVLIAAALVVLQMREAQEGAMELAGNAG